MSDDVKLQIVLAARNAAKAAFTEVTQSVNNLDRQIASLKSSAMGLAAAFGAGIGVAGLARQFEGVVGSFERLEAQLDVLYRGQGKKVFEDLNRMALELPVSNEAVIKSWMKMEAFGLKPTEDRLKTLVDVGTMFGEDVLDRIIIQLGQMSAKGKVMAQDLNVLAEANIRARQYIQEAFGMTVEQIQDSGIDIKEVIQVLFEGMARDFEGSAERMSTTWVGLKEKAKSYAVEVERTAANAGVFDAMKEALSGIVDLMKRWVEQNQELVRQNVTDAVATLRQTMDGIVRMYNSLPAEVTSAAGAGIVGRILFGGNIGMFMAAAAGARTLLERMANSTETMSAFDANVATMHGGADDFDQAAQEQFNRRVAGASGMLTGGMDDYFEDVKEEIREGYGDVVQAIEEGGKAVANAFDKYGGARSEFGVMRAQWRREQLKAVVAESKGSGKAEKSIWDDYKARPGYSEAEMADQKAYEEWKKYWESYKPRYSESQRSEAELADEKAMEDYKKKLEKEFNSWTELSAETARAMQSNFSDLFFDAMTGELKSFEDYATAIFRSIQRAAADMAGQMLTEKIFGAKSTGGTAGGGGWLSDIAGWIGGLFGSGTTTAAASGAVFAPAGMVRFAAGGVVNRPTVFPFATGVGLMGEAGPEAVMPLKRMPDGRLGVASSAPPAMNVTINVAAPQGRVDRESLSQMQTALYSTLQRAGRRNA